MALAYFLGCDYTEGVTGVGIVNALEIVQAFPMRLHSDATDGNTTQPALPGVNSASADISSSSGSATAGAVSDGKYPLEGLLKFKQWLEGYDFSETVLTKQKSKQKAEPLKKNIKLKRQRRGEKGSASKSKIKNKSGEDDMSPSDSDHDASSASSSDSEVGVKDKDHSPGNEAAAAVRNLRTKKGRSKTERGKSESCVDSENPGSTPGPGPSGTEGEIPAGGGSKQSSGEKVPPDLATRLVSVLCSNLSSASYLLLLIFCFLSSALTSSSLALLQYLFGKAHSSARARWSLKGNFPGIDCSVDAYPTKCCIYNNS